MNRYVNVWVALVVTALALLVGWLLGAGHAGQLQLGLGLLVFGLWSNPQTWTSIMVTAADMNREIRDNLNLLATCIDTATGSILVPAGKTMTVSGNAVFNATVTGSTIGVGAQYLGNCFPLLLGYQERWQQVNIVAGNLSIDVGNGVHVLVPLNANITSITLTSGLFGMPVTGYIVPIVLYFVNDGTLRTVTWTVNGIPVSFPGASNPTFSVTTPKVDTVLLKYMAGFKILGEQVGYSQ